MKRLVDPLRGFSIKRVITRNRTKATLARQAVELAINEQQRRDDSRIPNAGRRIRR